MTPFQHILVATDLGELSDPSLDCAIALARPFDAKITLLHVAELPASYYLIYAEGLAWPTEQLEGAARRALDLAVVQAKKRYDKIDGALAVGAPKTRIVEWAVEKKIDLIVMGTHGRKGLVRAFLGSVAEAVIRTSPIPVLTVSA